MSKAAGSIFIRRLSLAVFLISLYQLTVMKVNLLYLHYIEIESLSSLHVYPFAFWYSCFFVSGLTCAYLYNTKFHHAFLSSAFATIILSFWVIHAPTGSFESLLKLSNNIIIQQTGHLMANEGNYSNWPSLFFLGVFFAQIVKPQNFLTFFVVFNAWIIGLLEYVLARMVLRNPFTSFVATILALEGNIIMETFSYHPDYLAIPLVLLFTILSLRLYQQPRTYLLLGMVVSVAITESFMASAVLLVMLLAYYFYSRLVMTNEFRYMGNIFVFSLIVFIGWGIYWALSSSTGLILALQYNLHSLLGGFRHIAFSVSVKTAAPLWTDSVNFFWLGINIILPLLLAAILMLRKNYRRSATIAILSISALFVGGLSVLEGGTNFVVVLIYAPFAGPLVYLAVVKNRKRSSFIQGIFIAAMILLATPSFLAFNDTVQIGYNSPQEYGSGSFIIQHWTGGEVFSASYVIPYLDPFIKYEPPPPIYSFLSNSTLQAPQLLPSFNSYVDNLVVGGGLIDIQPSLLGYYQHLYGGSVAHTISNLLSSYIDNSDVVYTNGYDTVFV